MSLYKLPEMIAIGIPSRNGRNVFSVGSPIMAFYSQNVSDIFWDILTYRRYREKKTPLPVHWKADRLLAAFHEASLFGLLGLLL